MTTAGAHRPLPARSARTLGLRAADHRPSWRTTSGSPAGRSLTTTSWGLIPELERDASGYRRYDANAVIDLIRIKALADAGVPLARIEEVLSAGPEETGALTQIDRALAQRIRDLQEQRRRVSQLAAGDRLYVPGEIADLFDLFAAMNLNQTADPDRAGRLDPAGRPLSGPGPPVGQGEAGSAIQP